MLNLLQRWWDSIPHQSHPFHFYSVTWLPLFTISALLWFWILSLTFYSSDIPYQDIYNSCNK